MAVILGLTEQYRIYLQRLLLLYIYFLEAFLQQTIQKTIRTNCT